MNQEAQPIPNQNGLVNVRDPDTMEIGSIAAAQLPSAVAQGYEPVSNQEAAQFVKQQKFESTPEQLKTFGEGAASAATFGLSTGIERALGVKAEDIRARREVNPGVHALGQGAGLIGSALIPGLGEASASRAIEGAGVGAAEALGLGAEGAGTLSQIGAHSAKSATEFALLQSGDEVSKMLSGDPDQSVGTAAANIGLSGLLGAGVGGGLASISPLWKATTGNKLGQFIEDFKGRINEHLQNPNPAQVLSDELSSYHQGIKGLADEVYGAQGLKAQEIQKLVPELNDKMVEQANDFSSKLESTINEMRQKPNVYPERLVSKLDADLEGFKNNLGDATDSHRVFNAIQDLKQQIQSYSKFDKFVKPVDEAYDFVQKAKSLGYDLRTSLEDSDVWGKAADRQKAINKAFSEYLPTLQDFEKRFTTEVNGERVIDPGKINTYINQLGKPNAEIKQQMLDNFLKASENYRSVINETHANLGIESPFEGASLHHSMKSLEKLTPGARMADIFVKKGLANVGGQSLGALVGAGAGHAVGSAGLGALIGEHALGPFFSSILPAIAKPLLEGETSPTGLKSAIDYSLSVFKGEKLLDRGAKGVFNSESHVLADKSSVSDRDREKLDAKLKELQGNPTALIDSAGDTGKYLPNHAVSVGATNGNAVSYLNSLRPKSEKMSPLDKEPVINQVQKSKWENALTIAEQPLVVLERVKNGTLTAEDVIHLKTLYPGLYQRMSQKLTEQMIEYTTKGKDIPYSTRMSLSLFLGQPLDSTMTPNAIQAAQSHSVLNQNANQPTQKGTESLQKIPGIYQNSLQRSSSGRE